MEGRLKYGKYTDKDGIERNTVDIVATEMQLLGGREGGMGGGSGGGEDMGGGASARPAPAQRNAPAAKPAPAKSATSFDDMDDDIPF